MRHFGAGLLSSRQISVAVVLQHHLVLPGAEGISEQLRLLLRGKNQKRNGEKKKVCYHMHRALGHQ